MTRAAISTSDQMADPTASPPYGLFLTKSQLLHLFGTEEPVSLATGNHAYVFEGKMKDKVVKITDSLVDVGCLIGAQGTGVVPKLYESYELERGSCLSILQQNWLRKKPPHDPYSSHTTHRVRAHALVLERVIPISKAMYNASEEQLRAISDALYSQGITFDRQVAYPKHRYFGLTEDDRIVLMKLGSATSGPMIPFRIPLLGQGGGPHPSGQRPLKMTAFRRLAQRGAFPSPSFRADGPAHG